MDNWAVSKFCCCQQPTVNRLIQAFFALTRVLRVPPELGAGFLSSHRGHLGRGAHCPAALPPDSTGVLPRGSASHRRGCSLRTICVSLTRRLSIFSYGYAIFISAISFS